MTDSLKPLLDAYTKLSDTIIQKARDTFPRGTIVHWVRQGYRQRGEVKEVLGWQAHYLRLRVLNTRTGKFSDIYLYEIEELR